MLQTRDADAKDDDVTSAHAFFNMLFQMQIPLMNASLITKQASSKAHQIKLQNIYESTLNYFQDWLREQSIDPTDGIYRDTAAAFNYTGFYQAAFKRYLWRHNTIAHESFQFCVCSFCGQPQGTSLDLNEKTLLTVDNELEALWEIDHVISHPKQILCGDFKQAFFECADCKQPALYKIFFKQPSTEIAVALERQMSNDFKIQDLKTIPLIDFRLRQHEYQCTHFIRFHEHHYTLHVIDWEHNLGWTLDSLNDSKMRQATLAELETYLPEAKNLFLRKTSAAAHRIDADLNHFNFINNDVQTLQNLLTVKVSQILCADFCQILQMDT